MNDKLYHIYAKQKCLYHNLSKEEFENTWKMIHNFLSVIDSESVTVKKEDLSYEEVILDKSVIVDHWHGEIDNHYIIRYDTEVIHSIYG